MNKLKEIRESKNISRSALAVATGINLRNLEAYEQGRRSLSKASVETVYKIASMLGVSIEELTGLESHPIKIVDIDETEDNTNESHPSYYVSFDDGSVYEGVTTEDGEGDEGYDHIAHIRIGDVYADMDSFKKSIKF